jgi:gamma-glutamyltranspeptidase/glutathione hydrolase
MKWMILALGWNMFGLVGNEATVLPHKKDAEFHDTNIVEKNGAFMTVGSPGGSTIITSVLQTILNVYEYNFSMGSG